MQLSEFNYTLPPELIAQQPMEPRDHSRLLVIDRTKAQLSHQHFYNIVNYLNPGDVLVVNDSKVIPARLHGTKLTGGKCEVFLLKPVAPGQWECLLRHVSKPGTIIQLDDDITATVEQALGNGTFMVKFSDPNITRIGEIPLPPYITETAKPEQYQTVYAKHDGSVAAPTAGLHFTPELLQQLKNKGVIIAPVTLHVGLGTFASVKTENISQHQMHAEFAILPPSTAQAILQAKQLGHKVVAVGTTSCRTLESFHGQASQGWVDIFITPGYNFNTVDALITNFHLPKTTLLMLVSALAGKHLIDQAYQAAITERYRFYSFGDAMLIV